MPVVGVIARALRKAQRRLGSSKAFCLVTRLSIAGGKPCITPRRTGSLVSAAARLWALTRASSNAGSRRLQVGETSGGVKLILVISWRYSLRGAPIPTSQLNGEPTLNSV
ncbi:hypothetical protein D3C85_1481720 [compost metagenome]